MGGRTSEHDISLISGKEVVGNLSKDKYEVKSLVIPKEGRWFPKEFPETDVVFIAMHGPYGEDGTVQGMLEMMGIPYTGSGVLASALGNNKAVFRRLIKKHGFPIPKYIEVKKGENPIDIERKLGKPFYFVQPHNQGSAIGASIAKKKSDLRCFKNIY